jgi:hypothetical protein
MKKHPKALLPKTAAGMNARDVEYVLLLKWSWISRRKCGDES